MRHLADDSRHIFLFSLSAGWESASRCICQAQDLSYSLCAQFTLPSRSGRPGGDERGSVSMLEGKDQPAQSTAVRYAEALANERRIVAILKFADC